VDRDTEVGASSVGVEEDDCGKDSESEDLKREMRKLGLPTSFSSKNHNEDVTRSARPSRRREREKRPRKERVFRTNKTGILQNTTDENEARRKNNGDMFMDIDQDHTDLENTIRRTLRDILQRNKNKLPIGPLFSRMTEKLHGNITRGGKPVLLSKWLKAKFGGARLFLKKQTDLFRLQPGQINSTKALVTLIGNGLNENNNKTEKDFVFKENTFYTMKCTYWNPERGWGKLALATAAELKSLKCTETCNTQLATMGPAFVHHSELDHEILSRRLSVDAYVTCMLSMSKRGPEATRVKLLHNPIGSTENHTSGQQDAFIPEKWGADAEEDPVGAGEFGEEGREYHGKCVFWNKRGRWGKLLVIPFCKEVFVHSSQLKSKHRVLRIGERVRLKLATARMKKGESGQKNISQIGSGKLEKRFEAREVRVLVPTPKLVRRKGPENINQPKKESSRPRSHLL